MNERVNLGECPDMKGRIAPVVLSPGRSIIHLTGPVVDDVQNCARCGRLLAGWGFGKWKTGANLEERKERNYIQWTVIPVEVTEYVKS